MKLIAMEVDELDILSAHVQDMVADISAIRYLSDSKQLVLVGDRFCHEDLSDPRKRLLRQYRRCNAVLRVHHVDRVFSQNMPKAVENEGANLLSLLSVRFEPAELPAGSIYLWFGEGEQIRCEVECLEVSLSDEGNDRRTPVKPIHL